MKALYIQSLLVKDKEESIMKKYIVGTVLCMLLLIAVNPASPTTVPQIPSFQTTRGTTLYVGGLGPNNYTTIQEAVNAASAGDTVYVYDDSSPYRENIQINTSLSLIGEQKTTTVIDGMLQGNCVTVNADDVTITGFSIINGNDSGVFVYSNYTTIVNNIISDDYYGIRTSFGQPFGTTFNHNTITNNEITNNGAGITFFSGSNNTIVGNRITGSEQGISFSAGSDNNISRNIISGNVMGIWILVSYRTVIYHNNITGSTTGVTTFVSSAAKIFQNNFIGNNRSAISYESLFTKLRILKNNYNIPLRRNIWRQNYWEQPRTTPYVIPGVFLKFTLQIDWRPAQKPYLI